MKKWAFQYLDCPRCRSTLDKKMSIKTTLRLVVLCLSIFFICFFYIMSANRDNLTDTVPFSGDSFEYQSLAVNLYLGHGFQFGGLETFDTYKFDAPAELRNAPVYGSPANETLYNHFMSRREYSFHRTPGYPFFLAVIYKLFGMHPYAVKMIQIVLISLCAALMPIIGAHYWSKLGILSGVVSSCLFIKYPFLAQAPSQIMTETLIIFALFVLAIFIMLWEAEPTLIRTFLLGGISAVSILVKGSNIFLPLFLFAYIIFTINNPKKKMSLLPVFTLGFFLCMTPWSTYATQKNGGFVFLSTQTQNVLLDSNNEDSLKTGDWAPGWRKWNKNNPKYLYTRLKNSGYSPLKKVLIFMDQNKKDVPTLLKNKLYRAFFWYPGYLFTAGMIVYYLLCFLARKLKMFEAIADERIPLFPLMYFLNIVLLTLIFCGIPRFVMPFVPFFILPAVHILLKIFKLLLPNSSRATIAYL